MPGEETIVAVASPPGRGAISLVRLSGARAREVALGRFVCKSPCEPGKARVGRLVDEAGSAVDQVVLTYFPAPGSYTGEDLVEIGCHGSPVIVSAVLEVFLGDGVRPAEPGEFSLRAFLNGKMDLAQAEAVNDLVNSRTAFQAKVAREQLEGSLSRLLEPIRKDLVRMLCHLETTIEFVEEDLSPKGRRRLGEELENLGRRLDELMGRFAAGQAVRDGITVTLAGRTNVGKSSIFNRLVESERAIVTDLPGTTRDALSETIDLKGLEVRLVDTAGVRESSDRVERLGMKKSREYLEGADLVVFVLDQSEEFGEEEWRLWKEIRDRPHVLALNKEDLPGRLEIPEEVLSGGGLRVAVSALEGTHLEELKEGLFSLATGGDRLESETPLLTNVRHQRCVQESREWLRKGQAAYAEGMSEEFPLQDLRKSLESLGRITGETTTEEILGEIFSTFCVGK